MDPSEVVGRDARLPSWMGEAPAAERPRYDSVVVRGNGIGALVFAARLGRSGAFEGRVVLAGPAVKQDRRLIGGLTLRSRALDYYAAAYGRDRQQLLDRIFGADAKRAATDRQVGSYCVRRPDGSFEIVRPQPWLSSDEFEGRPLAFGVRNSHLAGCLEQCTRELGVRREEAPVDSVEACRALAPGRNPLVVNAGPKPLRPAELAAKRLVAAVQLPLAAPRRRERGILPDGASFFGATLREGQNDIGIFNPIVDPLSPAAEYYGIVYRVERAREDFDRERALGVLRDELHGMSDALGFEPVDADVTEGAAALPCSPWNHSGALSDGLLELAQVYDAGAPIITGDGMTRAGLAGLVAAEAVLAGEDPVAHANRALALWRRGNRVLFGGMTWAARIAALSIRLAPRGVLRVGAFPDSWAGVQAMEVPA
jgi:hypothetical protein